MELEGLVDLVPSTPECPLPWHAVRRKWVAITASGRSRPQVERTTNDSAAVRIQCPPTTQSRLPRAAA